MIMVTLTTARSLARRAVIPCALVTLFGLFFWLFGTGEIHTRIPLLSGKATVSVTIPQGTYLGIEAKSDFPRVLQQFLGIPYAKSTEGERRFLPPIPASLSKKTFLASKYGNRCPGGDPGVTPQTEDCLNLNIFRPKERVIGKLLPVLIYIHGGAFNFGYGHTREIANMVGWSSEPFLGISFNYRLGAFGFLPSSLMAREGLLNIGLKDQALLLEWVRKNIAAFGGNPDAVTIMGSSAGAHSVRSSLDIKLTMQAGALALT
jgi:acetylcholinesterase